MDSLVMVIEFGLFIIIAFWVGWPLVKVQADSGQASWWDDELLQDINEKEAIFNTLNEIEFDYSMGKLAPDDYEALKAKYQLMAVKVLESEEANVTSTVSFDELKGESELDVDMEAQIEAEIAAELQKLKLQQGGRKHADQQI